MEYGDIFMRILGLDIGDKTIGVAVSDPLFISAQGVTTIERITIVSGLPLMLSGEDSPQTQKVREFVEKLQNKARSTGMKLEFVFQDERFTTKIAEDVLIAADMRREKRKTIIDRQAAVIILQSYLDANRGKLTL